MSEIVNPKNLNWVSKNQALALIIALLFGNVYQWINQNKISDARAIENQEWAKKFETQTQNSLEYERRRSEQMELLLNHLSKDARK